MDGGSSRTRSHLTLVLCTVLHGFTHAFASMLGPLYLLIGVRQASTMVSLYLFVYCAGAYGAGILSDRFNRKMLLGVGLMGNAAAVTLMGFTRNEQLLLMFAALAGLFGTIFHPAAGALVPAHYPKHPGMAVGLLGIGTGLGFFAGPQFAGWRAETARWTVGGFQMVEWQRPCVELGLFGMMVGLVFLMVAKELPRATKGVVYPPLGRKMSMRILAIGGILGCRDFAAVASLSLAGIYLLRAHHFDTKHTGTILGTMMLLGMAVNPVLVWLTPGKRRLLALRVILVVGGLVVVTVPFFPAWLALPVLCAFQTSQMGSYAISDAALLERLPAALRGRGYGLFFTVAGLMASAGPRLMGAWTDSLGSRGNLASGYVLPFALLGLCMVMAMFAAPILNRLGGVVAVVEPITEIVPGSMEPVG